MTERDQEQESIALFEQHREMLVAEARAIRAKHPNAKVVGLILSPDSPEAARFREAMIAAGQAAPASVGIVMVVLRHFALSILRANAPATLDWIESDPEKLPMIAATKDGMRLGSASLEL